MKVFTTKPLNQNKMNNIMQIAVRFNDGYVLLADAAVNLVET